MQHGASNPEDKKLFAADKRQHLRRLASLGVYGHQPSIKGYCSTTAEENLAVTEAILQQKVAPVQKHIQHIIKVAKQEIKGETTRIKIIRIAFNAVVRWRRRTSTKDLNEQRPEWARYDEVKRYTTRLLTCRTCGVERETSWMQLRTPRGFRAVHCLSCKAYQVVTMHKCQCGSIWHQCPTHHIDPPHHRSAGRTAAKFKDAKNNSTPILLPAIRKKPTPPQPGRRVKQRGSKRGPTQLRGSQRPSSLLVPPPIEAVKRIRLREQTALERGDVQCEGCHRYHTADILCMACHTSKCTQCTTYEDCPACKLPLCLMCRRSYVHVCDQTKASDQIQPALTDTTSTARSPTTIEHAKPTTLSEPHAKSRRTSNEEQAKQSQQPDVHAYPSTSSEPPAKSRKTLIAELVMQSHLPRDHASQVVLASSSSSSRPSENAADQLDRMIQARSQCTRAGGVLRLEPPTKVAKTGMHSSNIDDALQRLLGKPSK